MRDLDRIIANLSAGHRTLTDDDAARILSALAKPAPSILWRIVKALCWGLATAFALLLVLASI